MTGLIPDVQDPTFCVPSNRLAWGEYDHDKDREVAGGDINEAYSADKIAMEGKVRKPFRWQGSLWVTVGNFGGGLRGIAQAEAYRIIPIKMFDGVATTYRDKTGTSERAEAARNDPNGFYHGMTVKYGKETYVMAGPEAIFTADPERPDAKPKTEQLEMFT